jgi:hypothetical protein
MTKKERENKKMTNNKTEKKERKILKIISVNIKNAFSAINMRLTKLVASDIAIASECTSQAMLIDFCLRMKFETKIIAEMLVSDNVLIEKKRCKSIKLALERIERHSVDFDTRIQKRNVIIDNLVARARKARIDQHEQILN